MNIQKAVLSYLMMAVCFSAYCQSEITVPWNQYAPTPKALELTRYGHMPPDMNSGVYSHDIPIYTYEDKDFTIPVNLHYSSSGFQPSKVSDEAGLHWTLMAGGAITREIVGVDDYKANGFNTNASTLSDSTLYNLLGSSPGNPLLEYTLQPTPAYNNKETASDRYHFTIPGHSGSFVMNNTRSGFLVYGTERGRGLYKVSYDSETKCFTITTGDGYIYHFGCDNLSFLDKAREVNWSREAVVGSPNPTELSEESYTIVTWLLDRITAPNGRSIRLYYDSTRRARPHDIPASWEDVLTSFSRQTYKINNTNYHKKASLTYTSYLSQIVVDTPLSSGEQLTIDFYWSRDTDREITGTENQVYEALIVPRRHLDSIKVHAGDQVLRQAELNYHRYGTRPLLTNVHLVGLGDYDMEYWTSNTMPGILTNAVDYWGYYNGQDNTSDAQTNPMGLDNDLNEYIEAHHSDPSWQSARLGTLKRITYPTGGYTDIEYEANQAQRILLRRYMEYGTSGIQPADPLDDPDIDFKHYLPSLFPVSTMSSAFAQDCGGVRVKRLTDYDGETLSSRAFTYSDGIIQQFPRYNSVKAYFCTLYEPSLRFPGSSFDQRHIAYGTVRQENPDSSYVVTTFTGWEDCPDEYSFHREQFWTSPTTLNQIFDDNIFREPDSRAYQRGLPIERKSYDNADHLVAQESWEYDDIGSGYRAYALYSGQYVWTARTFLCDRKPSRYVRKEWFDNTSNERTEQTDYAYNGLGQLRQTSRTVGNHTETQRITYPGDLANGVYLAMTAANYLDMPVEQVTIRDGKVVQGSLTTYNSFYNLFLPSASYHGNTRDGIAEASFIPYQGSSVDSFYELDNSFVGYDNVGNVTLSLNREGTPTTYYWDKRQDKLSALFVGGRNGVHSTYARGALSQTEMEIYINADPAEKTFTCDMAGSFSFSFTSVDTTNVITAKLDGSSIAVPRIGNGAQGTATPIPISSGTHTLQIVGTELHLRAHPIEDSPVSGTLSITYPKSGAVLVEANGQDCFFEDFESSTDGVLDFGFESSRGRLHTYSKTISVIPNRTYFLDYMQKVNGEWQYMRESFTPTSDSLTLTISAQQSSPVDHVRFYPADCAAASFTWWPTGELRCRVDGDGLKETYEYDTLGRLIHVRDNDGNIVKEYSYNYIH